MLDWKEKRVIIIGAARQGISLGRYLAQHEARVVMNDQKPADQLVSARQQLNDLPAEVNSRIEWHLGDHSLSLLEGADYICPSGGVPLDLPLVREAVKRGIPLTNDSQVFLEACPCTTIGITGSAGKTTTTTLVGNIAQVAIDSGQDQPYRKAWVGGNIGAPLIAELDSMHADDLAVMELSSFQLELMTRSVNIACVLNITPNHLDRHATMEDYISAKRRILEFQEKHSAAILGSDDPVAWSLAGMIHGDLYSFGQKKPAGVRKGAFIEGDWLCVYEGEKVTQVLRCSDIPLRGWHNVENVLAACAISLAANLPPAAMRKATSEFSGVPHRLEWVSAWKGADWYNDSIATAPERVIAAIHSFDNPADQNRPIILLAGGRDKNLPWDSLVELIQARVDHVILFGEAAEKIASHIKQAKPGARPFSVEKCSALEQAVKVAAREAAPGDIVLLSPGGTSFDEFRDFEERGEAFKRWVSNLSCA